MVAKGEWQQGELFPRVGFIVTNLGGGAKPVVDFYNRRGTAEQWIKEGKHAVRWTRLSCHSFEANQVRLQLHVLAYNLGNFLRRLAREALDAHDAVGEADQDRGEGGASRPIRDVPTGGGGNPAGAVSGHSTSHPPVRRDLPEGCTDMTSRGNWKI